MSDTSLWFSQLLASLERCGEDGHMAVQYVQQHAILVGFHSQPAAARWTLCRHIQLSPRYAGDTSDEPYVLSLIVHEVRHLWQGSLVALSVYGELDAWRTQFAFLQSLTGRYHELPTHDRTIAKLLSLPLCWDRLVLKQARALMQLFAGPRYRVDLMPLYPLQWELLFYLSRKQPAWNLPVAWG